MANVQPPVIRPWDPNTSNEAIIRSIRNDASSQYQRYIPDEIKGDVSATLKQLNNYKPLMNEFVEAIVNKIGLTIARNNSWSNPLARYKKGLVENGDTVEELQVGLLETYAYDPRREYGEKANFGKHIPRVESAYHRINSERQIPLTIQRSTLQRAFTTQGGLSDFITRLMDAPSTKDNLDEFLLMTSLFSTYEELDGFFKVHIPDIEDYASTKDDASMALRIMREYAETLPFLSERYNAAGMPTFAEPEKMLLIATPAFKSALDVNGLAAMFNVSYAEVPYRTHVIPQEHIGIEGVGGILTTEDFFQVYDTYFDTDTMNNPAGRYYNTFLNHDQIISASRFVPALAFTTGEGTVITISDAPVTAISDITITDSEGNEVTDGKVERGGYYVVNAEAVTDGDNSAVELTLTGKNSNFTFLDQHGPFHVALDETADKLTIHVRAEDDQALTKTLEVTVVGTGASVWPPELIEDSDKDGIEEATPTKPKFEANVIKVPNSERVEYKDGATTVNGQDITLTTGSKTITATAKTGYEIKSGATASWTFTFAA